MSTEDGLPTAPVQPMVSLLDAITFDVVGDKQVPLLHFPDGSRIHLAPWKMPDGGQDPTVVLMRWLRDWCNHVARTPLRDAWSDIAQWVRLAEWQRDELPHNQNVCPNQTGIEYSRDLQKRIQLALAAMRSQVEVSSNEVTRAYEAPEEDKPLLPQWVKE